MPQALWLTLAVALPIGGIFFYCLARIASRSDSAMTPPAQPEPPDSGSQ